LPHDILRQDIPFQMFVEARKSFIFMDILFEVKFIEEKLFEQIIYGFGHKKMDKHLFISSRRIETTRIIEHHIVIIY
jgi:hypothetical protein